MYCTYQSAWLPAWLCQHILFSSNSHIFVEVFFCFYARTKYNVRKAYATSWRGDLTLAVIDVFRECMLSIERNAINSINCTLSGTCTQKLRNKHTMTAVLLLLFKKNLNASKPSEHPPSGEKMSEGLGGNIGCRDKTS